MMDFRCKLEHEMNVRRTYYPPSKDADWLVIVVQGLHKLTLTGSALQQAAQAGFRAHMLKVLENRPQLAELRTFSAICESNSIRLLFVAVIPDYSVCTRRLTPAPGFLNAVCQDNVSHTEQCIQGPALTTPAV